jgi:hypothetical protein
MARFAGERRIRRAGEIRGGVAAGWARLAFAVVLMTSLTVRAQEGGPSSPPDSLRRELDGMRARQDALEQENARLREQVGALREQVGGSGAPPGAAAKAGESAPATLDPGGNGAYIGGKDSSFRLAGYAQAVGSMFDGRMKRSDGSGEFFVRGARLDFMANFLQNYDLLLEVDAAPGNPTPGSSNFGLVVASLNSKLMGDALQLEVGKVIDPFSTENYRSSRDLDTIERYQALNSLFLLPALDAQYGLTLHGETGGDQKFGYYLGAYNGNGQAFKNLPDNNGRKELVGKLTYGSGQFSAGLGFDYSHEQQQTLSLTDLGFNNFVSVPIRGQRIGFGGDAFWESGPFSVRAEGLAFRMDLDRNPPGGIAFENVAGHNVSLVGGYLQPAVYLWGDHSRGFQLLMRGEVSHLGLRGGPDGDTLYGLTLGANWFLNPNVRLQVDGVLHYFNGSSQLLGFNDRKLIPMLLTELQIKF